MRVRVGQLAPNFAVEDYFGRQVALSNYRGRSVLVSFYRAAVCPLCNLRLAHLIRRYADYQRAGLDMIAFFESSSARTHQYLDRQRPPFPIIADRERIVYSQYGLESSWGGFLRAVMRRRSDFHDARKLGIGGKNDLITIKDTDGSMSRLPGDFVIDPTGHIRFAYYAHDSGDFALLRDIEVAAFGRPLPEPTPGDRPRLAVSSPHWR